MNKNNQNKIIEYSTDINALSLKLDNLEMLDKKHSTEYYQTLIDLQTRLKQLEDLFKNPLKKYLFIQKSKPVRSHIERELKKIDIHAREPTNRY